MRLPLIPLVLGLAVVLGAAQQVVEEIVAIVNDDVITLSEYKREYELRVETIRAQAQAQQGVTQEQIDKALAQMKAGLLEAMITDKLLLQMAREKNLNVSDDIKRAVEAIKKENNIESDEDLKRALASQGLSYEAWLKQLEETLLRRNLIGYEVDRLIVLDDAEIVDYYKKHEAEFTEPEEYTLRAVYLAAGSTESAGLEARKKEVEDKLKSGADIGEVSAAFSDEPLKDAKGDLGTFKKGELDKSLLAAVEKMKKGEVSSWVQTKNGWYLVKLEDKKDSRVKTFEEAKSAIQDKLWTEKENEKLMEFLNNVKKRSHIKILKPNPLG
jgi:parvulin-like peptidyl-prolyl isomerase